MESAVWGLVGTVVGALASIGTTWLSTRTTEKLQLAKSHADQTEKSKAFQVQTLLTLQDTMHDYLRLVARAYIEDRQSLKNDVAWGKQNLSQEVNDGLATHRRRLAILIERISDQEIRVEIKSVIRATTEVHFAKSEPDAWQKLETSNRSAERALENLGAVLRMNY